MRSDRTLGTKPYSNATRRLPPARRASGVTLGRVLRILLLVATGTAIGVGLAATSACQPGVRCAD